MHAEGGRETAGRRWEDQRRGQHLADAFGVTGEEMRAMIAVMLEDSIYLDTCAQEQRVNASRHRFQVCGEDAMDCDEPAKEPHGVDLLEGQFELNMPLLDDTFTEDELLFSEFHDERGEGTACASTCSLLLRACKDFGDRPTVIVGGETKERALLRQNVSQHVAACGNVKA